MSLISRVIRSLINGVSQQAPSVRLDNQVEEQVNMIPDISGVLTRRSPVALDDIIAQDGSRVYAEEHAMFNVTINEEAVALGVKPDGTVYRFDENFANTTTITQAASVKTYLTHTDKKNISIVETSDSIILLNKGVEVALNAAPVASTTLAQRALVWITTAQNGATYKIYKNGVATAVAHYKAGTTDTPATIMKGLIDGTVTGTAVSTSNMTATFTGTKSFHQENNTAIVRNDSLDNLTVECDYGTYMYTIKEAELGNDKTVIDPSILPAKIATGVTDGLNPVGTANFLVRVNPSVNEDLTTYYLRYSADFEAWVEESDGYVTSLDNETMPATIVKDTVTTITVAHSTFLPPAAGDNLSNPSPTLVGSKIKDMIVYNSRLGFATESTLVFSAIDEYYTFYRTTTASSLISDVVDLELDSSKLGYRSIDNIFVLDNSIIINTGLTQSKLALPQNLDISRAIFAHIASFDLGSNVPVPIRRSMYFPIKSGSFSTVKAFAPDVETGSGFTDNSVTKHCEKFIRGSIIQSVFYNDIYIARTDHDPKNLYVQHTYVSEGTVLQNAWHKWTFAYDIKYVYSTGDSLKIVFEDTDNTQTIYGSLDLSPAEITEDTPTQIGYVPYLDFYTTDTSLSALLSNIITVDTQLGKLVTSGDANSVDGIKFESYVTLSEIIPKDGDGNKIGYALLMLRRMSVTLGYTGRLNITVTRSRRTVYTHNFIPQLLGNIVIGREPVSTHDARFPVNGRSQDVVVKISTVDTFTPLQLISLEWQGQLISKGGR